jgi:hypothetical protein
MSSTYTEKQDSNGESRKRRKEDDSDVCNGEAQIIDAALRPACTLPLKRFLI